MEKREREMRNEWGQRKKGQNRWKEREKDRRVRGGDEMKNGGGG